MEVAVALVVRDVGPNKFMFSFQEGLHRDRVLEHGPWNFRGFLLVFRPWSRRDLISHLDFSTCDFWVQIHGLPFEKLSSVNATLIGASLGSVVAVDKMVDADASVLDFFRVKIVLMVARPFTLGFPLSEADSPPLWLTFKYEQLSGICTTCGCIDHLASLYDSLHPHPFHSFLGPFMKAFPPRPLFPLPPSMPSLGSLVKGKVICGVESSSGADEPMVTPVPSRLAVAVLPSSRAVVGGSLGVSQSEIRPPVVQPHSFNASLTFLASGWQCLQPSGAFPNLVIPFALPSTSSLTPHPLPIAPSVGLAFSSNPSPSPPLLSQISPSHGFGAPVDPDPPSDPPSPPLITHNPPLMILPSFANLVVPATPPSSSDSFTLSPTSKAIWFAKVAECERLFPPSPSRRLGEKRALSFASPKASLSSWRQRESIGSIIDEEDNPTLGSLRSRRRRLSWKATPATSDVDCSPPSTKTLRAGHTQPRPAI